jgi:hypothetical protein
MSNDKVSWIIKRGLTEEEIKDILTTAIEGGIGYWAILGNDHPNWVAAKAKLLETKKEIYYCDVAYEVLAAGNKVYLYDAEEEDEDVVPWSFDLTDFQDGCRLYEVVTGKDIHKEMEDGGFDAIDADMIIQYATFGEIIYG